MSEFEAWQAAQESQRLLERVTSLPPGDAGCPIRFDAGLGLGFKQFNQAEGIRTIVDAAGHDAAKTVIDLLLAPQRPISLEVWISPGQHLNWSARFQGSKSLAGSTAITRPMQRASAR